MEHAEPITRLYTGSDATMRQQMRTMQGHYLTDQAAFAAFNPSFTAAFGTSWAAALDAADAATPGAGRVGELKEDTQAVEAVMEKARTQVQGLFYFVEQAYPGNKARLDQYGKKLYEKARNNHDKMRELLELAATAAERDKVALAAKGFSAAKLTALKAFPDQLTQANTTQEMKKGTNVEDGDGFVQLQNAAYGFGRQVSEAAKVAFAGDYAKQQLYRLTAPAAAGPETHELPLKTGALKTLLLETLLTATSTLRLRVQEAEASVSVQLVLAPDAGGGTPLTVAGPEPVLVPAATLGTGQYLLASHAAGPTAVRLHVEVVE
ncbi:hypothetical protein [Hymenobacter guriensis]|uniref:Uncharacterized protein n=1 Tax=Hymenobacter guriensis TaxID=2793065 RepID=A0ABS0KXV0_9BACT|nr:hypothetical protein [Hymenobacter guriensis]MBG8552636.1 hypothetical protein [Hymenobacter guriensis]